MQEAKLKNVDVEISAAKDHLFKATGQTILFPGFMKVYIEGEDTDPNAETTSAKKSGKHEKILPPLKEGEDLKCEKIDPTQHFTQPPHRYTEASLVKKLESEGIGRPSTYAPTITTITTRGYIEKEGRALKPTDTGMVVTDLLVDHFPDIVDYKFTAEMEEDLDLIAEGKKEWVPLIKTFYTPFHKLIEDKEKTLKKSDVVNEETDEVCEKCGSKMVIKLGRYGKFLSCSNYPECKNAKPLEKNGDEGKAEPEVDPELKKKLSGKKCEKCGSPMEIKKGRYGEFLGCSNYPKCKNIQPIIKFSGVKCPECKEGQLVERRTRKGGKVFYGCNKYPKCKFAVWDKPLKEKCKKCGGLMVEKGKKKKCIKCDK
jgi:DNA topoisomerase-1